MRSTLRTRWGGDQISVTADWAQAAGSVEGAPGQVADYRHNPRLAIRQALIEAAQADGLDPDDMDCAMDIDAAVRAAKWEVSNA